MGKPHPYQLYINIDALNLKKHANPKEYITIKLLDKPVYDGFVKAHSKDLNTVSIMDPKDPEGEVYVHHMSIMNNFSEDFIILLEFDVPTDVRDFLEFLTIENVFGLVITHLLEKHLNYIFKYIEYTLNFKYKIPEKDADAIDNL